MWEKIPVCCSQNSTYQYFVIVTLFFKVHNDYRDFLVQFKDIEHFLVQRKEISNKKIAVFLIRWDGKLVLRYVSVQKQSCQWKCKKKRTRHILSVTACHKVCTRLNWGLGALSHIWLSNYLVHYCSALSDIRGKSIELD